jgi:hypothetical protein
MVTFLRKLNRLSETVQAYSAFVGRFGDSVDPSIRVMVAVALGASVEQLVRGTRYGEAIEAADELDARFLEDATPAIRQHVTDALCKRAEVLGKLARWGDALATDERVNEPRERLTNDRGNTLEGNGNGSPSGPDS